MMVSSILMTISVGEEMKTPYEQIFETEYMTLEDALVKLENATETESVLMRNDIQTIMACCGVYVQQDEYDKDYHATVNCYLKYGVPYCQLSYDNFMGTLCDAEIYCIEEQPYDLFLTPMGERFYSKNNLQAFSVWIGKSQMRIIWGDGKRQYYLNRIMEQELVVTDERTKAEKFLESEGYQQISTVLESMLKGAKYKVRWSAADRTLTVWFALQNGMRWHVVNNTNNVQATLESIMESFRGLSGQLQDSLTLLVRQGWNDYDQAHCKIMMVDQIREDDLYNRTTEVIFQVCNGYISYYCVEQ